MYKQWINKDELALKSNRIINESLIHNNNISINFATYPSDEENNFINKIVNKIDGEYVYRIPVIYLDKVMGHLTAINYKMNNITKYEKTIINLIKKNIEKEVSIMDLSNRYKNIFNKNVVHSVIYEAINDGKNFIIKMINDKFVETEKIEKDDIINKKLCDVLPSAKSMGLFSSLERVYKTNKPDYISGKYYKSIKKYIDISIFKINDKNLIGYYKENTDEIKKINKTNKQKVLFEQLFHESNEAIALLDSTFNVVKINESFEKLFKYKNELVIGKNIDSLITPEKHLKTALNYGKKVILGSDIKSEEKRKDSKGKLIDVSIHAFPIEFDHNDLGIYAIYNDISKRKIEEKRIKYLSYHDQLTGVYNRHYIQNEVKRINNSRLLPISVIMGDIDKLKYVNDNYGHTEGDSYIKLVASSIKEVLRAEEILARLGGDEFLIIMPLTSEESARKVIKRIHSNIESKSGLKPYPINISLGVATKIDEKDSLEEIITAADNKMYEVKGPDNIKKITLKI